MSENGFFFVLGIKGDVKYSVPGLYANAAAFCIRDWGIHRVWCLGGGSWGCLSTELHPQPFLFFSLGVDLLCSVFHLPLLE